MKLLHPRKILFANVPADGHFSPLTGLAVYLKNAGHDVRWYASSSYAEKLAELQIPHFPFITAVDIDDERHSRITKERDAIKGQIKKLTYDLIHGFTLRGPEYFEDIRVLQISFPFDVVVCDCAFTAIPIIREKLNVPVIAMGVLPLIETSRDIAPMGLGLTPSHTFFGRIKQHVLRFLADKVLFKKTYEVMEEAMKPFGIAMEGSNIFDMMSRKSTLVLQSGTPGFEYTRSDLSDNIRFIGALLPHSAKQEHESWYHEKLQRYKKVLLITQGTLEKDITKLLIPALEAFKNTKYLVIVTTGGSQTKLLQEKYACDNIIIEDFIPFASVMPHADVYITNGGYGGVMLGIQNGLPIVAAGVHEGKNEINARIEYFKFGINLRTERPSPKQLAASVDKIINDSSYEQNVKNLRDEFDQYRTNELCTFYIEDLAKPCVQTKRRTIL